MRLKKESFRISPTLLLYIFRHGIFYLCSKNDVLNLFSIDKLPHICTLKGIYHITCRFEKNTKLGIHVDVVGVISRHEY
jgi:Leu/Phe-tRNA-protein transferase